MNLIEKINNNCHLDRPRLSLLLIPSEKACSYSWCAKHIHESLPKNVVEFSAYTHPQLVEILCERIKAGVDLTIASSQIVEQVAAIAEKKKGNARYALNLFFRAGKSAERRDKLIIYTQDIQTAKEEIRQSEKSKFIEILRGKIQKNKKQLGDISLDVIEQIAMITVDEERNDLFALDLLYRAQKRAQNIGLPIDLCHVRDAKRQVYKPQLIAILNEKVKLSKVSFISQDVLEQIAVFAVDERGSTSFAVELLDFIIINARNKGISELYPDLVREVGSKRTNSIVFNISNLHELTKHELIVLLGISRQLQSTEGVYLSLRETIMAYSLICERMHIRAKGKQDIIQICQSLANSDFLRVVFNIQDGQYRDAQISIDIPLKELESSIEDLFET